MSASLPFYAPPSQGGITQRIPPIPASEGDPRIKFEDQNARFALFRPTQGSVTGAVQGKRTERSLTDNEFVILPGLGRRYFY
jgi:hypothetical protein